jgi:hypothetical protein
MTKVATGVAVGTQVMSERGDALADRLEQGARALAALARGLTEAQWQTRLPKDGRKVGVIVHHVASMYPLEIELAQLLAAGKPITGVTWEAVHAINAGHAKDNDAHHEGRCARAAGAEQRRRGGGHPRPHRRAVRSRGHDLALQRRAAHLPVHARGPCRASQLSHLARIQAALEA